MKTTLETLSWRGRIENIINSKHFPVLSLLLISFLVFILFLVTGAFTIKIHPDSSTYLKLADRFNTKEILTGIRTFGYPLLLKSTLQISRDLSLLPFVQFALHVGAVFLFYFSLRTLIFSKLMAFFSTVPLLNLAIFREYVGSVMTDLPAVSLGIVTMSLLFIVTSRRAAAIYYILLSMALLLTYQFRPSMVYLIGFVPVFGIFLYILKNRPAPTPLLKQAARLILLSLIPFVCFSLFRYSHVKEFGLSSLDGYSLGGSALYSLDEQDLKRIPPHLSGIAEKILKEKSVRLPPADPSDYEQLHRDYDVILWSITDPILGDEFGRDYVKRNRALREISLSIIRHHKAWYFNLVLHSFKRCCLLIFYKRSFDVFFWGLLFLLTCLFYFAVCVKTKRVHDILSFRRSLSSLHILILLAAGNFAFGILPMLFFHPPIRRFILGIDLYFMPLLGAAGLLIFRQAVHLISAEPAETASR